VLRPHLRIKRAAGSEGNEEKGSLKDNRNSDAELRSVISRDVLLRQK
jgi:hypothetical protein